MTRRSDFGFSLIHLTLTSRIVDFIFIFVFGDFSRVYPSAIDKYGHMCSSRCYLSHFAVKLNAFCLPLSIGNCEFQLTFVSVSARIDIGGRTRTKTMSNQCQNLIALLSCGVLLSTCGLCLAYQERPDFCIDTEPLLLDDISKQVFVLSEKQLRCNVTATTLTAKEKESLIDTLCRDHGSTLGQHSHHHYFKLHNGELNGRGTQQDICAQSARSMLAWVPYKTMLLQYGHELNPKERLSYMAKATSVEREKTELCHFRHTDLVNGVQDNLFTCVVMIFEDNFYGVEDNINVLVELQPLMYQLRNITYSPWRNVTNSYKMRLGSSVLRNPSGQRKPIYGSINYAFVEKIRLNISSVYGQSSLKRLPLLLEHRGSVLELDAAGVGGMDVQEQAYFGRTMDAKTEVQLQVIGQWMDQHREFTADIYEYYGHGLLLYKQAIAGGRVTFVRIDSTEPAFEAPESQNLAKASLFVDPAAMPAKLSVNSSVSEWHEEQQEDENNSSFYPWFVLSCLLIGIVVLVLVYGVVRVNNKKNQQRQKYELPNANKPPPTVA